MHSPVLFSKKKLLPLARGKVGMRIKAGTPAWKLHKRSYVMSRAPHQPLPGGARQENAPSPYQGEGWDEDKRWCVRIMAVIYACATNRPIPMGVELLNGWPGSFYLSILNYTKEA
jgi:hypothetical protein